MASFELSHSADQDLEKIIRYTVVNWDVEQAVKYTGLLDRHFEMISRGEALVKAIFPHRNDVLVSRCQKLVVFHLARADESPLILAVFHESMDLMRRVEVRLDNLGI